MLVSFRRRVYLKRIWLGVAILSLLTAAALTIVGKATDCKPHEVDGQCGLSTFLGAFYGVIFVILANLAMGVLSLALTFWWDRHPLEKEQEAD